MFSCFFPPGGTPWLRKIELLEVMLSASFSISQLWHCVDVIWNDLTILDDLPHFTTEHTMKRNEHNTHTHEPPQKPWTEVGLRNFMDLLNTRGKQWDLPKFAMPLETNSRLCSCTSHYFSNIHIRDTQIAVHHIYICDHMCIYIYHLDSFSSFLQAIPPKFTAHHYRTKVW